MRTILIRCPKTGQAISTGKAAASASVFRSMPVFFGHTYCPYCRQMHEWFAKEGWVDDSEMPVVEKSSTRARSESRC
jgi:hypothetical protein